MRENDDHMETAEEVLENILTGAEDGFRVLPRTPCPTTIQTVEAHSVIGVVLAEVALIIIGALLFGRFGPEKYRFFRNEEKYNLSSNIDDYRCVHAAFHSRAKKDSVIVRDKDGTEYPLVDCPRGGKYYDGDDHGLDENEAVELKDCL